MLESYNTHTHTHTLTKHNHSQQNGLLLTGLGKFQHLPKWFGTSPKWKRLQAFSEFYHLTVANAGMYR
jgi:hypothetical protein